MVMVSLPGWLDVVIHSKFAWLSYLFFLYAILIYGSVYGVRFILRKNSSIFKQKDKPGYHKSIDVAAKGVIAVGLVIVTIVYTLPFTLDIPYIVTGKEKFASVITIGHYDSRQERRSVMPPEILVRNISDGTEFRIYLFTGGQKSGEVLDIEYLPFSKQAYVLR